MIGHGLAPIPQARQSRAVLAGERAGHARDLLADCRLCAHDCGVNRLAGQTGMCHAAAQTRYFSGQIEVSDEMELIPTFAIALSGCDLRCDFCITGASSWNAQAGNTLDATAMAARAKTALRNGARTVMILGGEPTIHLPGALEIVSQLPSTATLVWKTNAHGSAQARQLLEGMFDVWLADFKFGNDHCARRLARVADYTRVVQENLSWAQAHGHLIVRHLLMPGHGECCWQPVAEWLAVHLPGVKVNLRTGFWPAWRARRHVEFRSRASTAEIDRAFGLARELGLNLIP
ncbi:MAG: radical SAM protein [Verrucomicrobiota bacterium]|jgi:putative pyruvate formate lyase activating enzyme